MTGITIDMPPVAAPRARVTRFGTFYPPKYKKYKAEMKAHLESMGVCYEEGPLKVRLRFYLSRPKSVSPKKRPFPIVKPDLDNYIKSILDAGNKILWKDDSQIISLTAEKYYTPKTIQPRTEIYIEKVIEPT